MHIVIKSMNACWFLETFLNAFTLYVKLIINKIMSHNKQNFHLYPLQQEFI